MTHSASTIAAKFAKLADYLEQASRLARELSKTSAGKQPLISKDQAWFWTKHWQALEHKVDKDIEEGRVTGPFQSVDDLIASLKQ